MGGPERDIEPMRERILEAGLAEFAEHGLAGARVDRIAATAGVNKNSIYRYFPGKDEIFAAVLQRHMDRVLVEVPFTPDDLPGFAVRLFDYVLDHPQIMRLVAWSGLERPAATGKRVASMRDKLDTIGARQDGGAIAGDIAPSVIFTVITAISTAWSPVNPFWALIDADAIADRDALRSAIARMVARAFDIPATARDAR